MGKPSEFTAPSLGDRACELRAECAEERKRSACPIFLSHEKKGWGWGEEKDCKGRTDGIRSGEEGDPFAECPVSDLVVVLEEGNEGGRGEKGAWLAPWFSVPVGGGLALVRESLCKGSGEVSDRLIRIVLVVAVLLSGEEAVERVV